MGANAELKTERLTLRGLRMNDAQAVTDGIKDIRVLRNLTSPPYPYNLADAQDFLAGPGQEAGNYAICFESLLIGVITLRANNDLGYWLGRPFWGNGYASEAAHAVVSDHFIYSDETLTSGHVMDNDASRNVLRKLGFRDTGRVTKYVPAREEQCEIQRMQLTRADWDFACDPRIDTLRLTLKPLRESNARALSEIANDAGVLRMTGGMPLPFGVNEARAWITSGQYKGRAGFKFGIWQDETLIGALGIGGYPVSTMFWLGRDFWGKGFASEAMRGFLTDMMPRLGLDQVVADSFTENAASQRVLEKLGFEKTGEGMARSRARLEPAPVIAYRLQAEKLKA